MEPSRTDFFLSLYPTLVTPYTKEGAIDYPSLDRFLHALSQMGMDGVFAVCQSSEMFYLSEEEQLELAAHCLERCRALGMGCVVSGHTQDALKDQIAYLRKLEALRPDAIILVTNRLAGPEESDAVLLERLNRILAALRPETRLGLYECPYPYKRLLSDTVIDAVAQSGRFDFLKDTCCDADRIRERVARLKGSCVRLYNANAATLLASLADGAAGYSGVLLNCMPEMFIQLRDSLPTRPTERELVRSAAARIASFLSMASIMEYQNYPVNAKYWLTRRQLFATTYTRTGRPALTPSQTREMDDLMQQYEYALAALAPRARTVPLFEAGRHFPSCHASTVLPLPDGDVLVCYFAGEREGADDVGIWLSRRTQGVWEAPRCIAKLAEVPHWNPVLFATDEGVRVVFKVSKKISSWKSYTLFSRDGGRTFGAPVPYAEDNDAGGPVRSKPIRLADGTLLAPNSDETDERWTVRVDRSTDEGASFARYADIPLNLSDPDAPDFIAGKGAIQPTLWTDGEGCVHALLRTTCGSIYRSDSQDNGKTWRTAYDTGLPNNNSGIDVAAHGGDLYLVMNPTRGNWAPRTPLVILRSKDNAHTFLPFVTLEDLPLDPANGASAEFSYPALVAAENRLFVSYTHLRRQIAFAEIPLTE